MSDQLNLPFFAYLQRALLNGTSPLTGVSPGGSTTTVYDYATVRDLTSDSQKVWTIFQGDPNAQSFIAPDVSIESVTIKGDATANDGVVQLDVSGWSGAVDDIASPTYPSKTTSSLLAAAHAAIYVDSTSAIGTTEYTDYLTTYEVMIPSGRVPKKVAQGAGAELGPTRRGVDGTTTPTMKPSFEWNPTLRALARNQTQVKVRLVLSGVFIETAASVDYYESITIDMYGILELDSTGDNAGTNETRTYLLEGEVNSAIASDVRVVTRLSTSTI